MTHLLCPACGKPLTYVHQTHLTWDDRLTPAKAYACASCHRAWTADQLERAVRSVDALEQTMLPGCAPTKQGGFWE